MVKKVKIRFLAIDTPEVDKNEPYSREAKEYTCNALKNAKEIYFHNNYFPHFRL